MIGLVDCNNFYVSCERVFNPRLLGKPVVVMSSNDGCAVAMSQEAKDIGITRGVPIFQVRDIIRRHNVEVLSCNFPLYGDMSSRVMSVVTEMAPSIEVYSIDEAFFAVDCNDKENLHERGKTLRKRILKATGIPTSVGIASTKTLAKVAARFAKRYKGYDGACVIDTPEKVEKALMLTQIGDVWGIGRRTTARFLDEGVTTAYQLASMSEEEIKRRFNVVGQRTWMELNGTTAVGSEPLSRAKEQITTSRSFAHTTSSQSKLSEYIAQFATLCASKLRAQNSNALAITVFVFPKGDNRGLGKCSFAEVTLPEPSADTLTIVSHSLLALRSIYRKNTEYKKAGVIISKILDVAQSQFSLFIPENERMKRTNLMTTVDDINSILGELSPVKVAAAGNDRIVKSEHRSRRFSTRLTDIIEVHAGPLSSDSIGNTFDGDTSIV